jgi:hypothetical protein
VGSDINSRQSFRIEIINEKPPKQWRSTCLACARHWVQSLALEGKKNEKNCWKSPHNKVLKVHVKKNYKK